MCTKYNVVVCLKNDKIKEKKANTFVEIGKKPAVSKWFVNGG